LLKGKLSVAEQEFVAVEIWLRLLSRYEPGFLDELFLTEPSMRPSDPGFHEFLVRLCEKWGYFPTMSAGISCQLTGHTKTTGPAHEDDWASQSPGAEVILH
jgi:hypothetical protein